MSKELPVAHPMGRHSDVISIVIEKQKYCDAYNVILTAVPTPENPDGSFERIYIACGRTLDQAKELYEALLVAQSQPDNY